MGTTVVGFALLLLGAVCGGSFGLPSKFVRKGTPWETLWGPFFFFVTILIPTTVFPFIAKDLFTTCAEAGTAGVLMPVLFGFFWGLGSMTLGISFGLIGLSLAYALNYGAQIAVGGMGPFIIHHSDQLTTAHGFTFMGGVAVCILGVVVCGRAATLRSKSQAGDGDSQTIFTGGNLIKDLLAAFVSFSACAFGLIVRPRTATLKKKSQTREGGDQTVLAGDKLMKGLIVAILSGVLCACYGIAVSFGGDVTNISVDQYGNPGWRAAFVLAALVLWGGSLSACGYCVYKFCVNKTWSTLAQPGIGKILFIALIMACLHDGAILFFGVGVPKLGTQTFGAAIAYPVFMSFAIIVGNVNGFLAKEWKGASKQSIYWIITGIIILIVGVSVFAKGSAMKGQYDKSHPTSTGGS